MISTSTIFSSQGKGPPVSSPREVIRLSPDGAASETNTQQGKIAAALLKAGVSAPEQTVRRVASGNLVQSLDLNASKILVKGGSTDATHMFGEGAVAQPFHWKPAVMVWSGPILTLACLYILAVHFGWL